MLIPANRIIHRTATFSSCRVYRYALWRRWDEGPYCLFIGLNPSTADETHDDNTIRRCIRFANDWGYDGLCMANLFALRATDPAVMKAHDNPIGSENDAYLTDLSASAGIVIAAWGAHGVHMNRDKEVMARLSNIHHIGLTQSGCPRHPLYVRAETRPMPIIQD